MGPLLLETRCQPVVLIHRSHSPVVVAHSDESPGCVTGHKWSYGYKVVLGMLQGLLGGAGAGGVHSIPAVFESSALDLRVILSRM